MTLNELYVLCIHVLGLGLGYDVKFKFSFHISKKGICDFCEGLHNFTEEAKITFQEKYNIHVEENYTSMSTRRVLILLLVSKLNVYNFTIYEMQSTRANCFLWHEGFANRGANE
ncbi:hypothetical protein PR048_011493 [Dryococelus australis]|uniref:Uncharacterized protein n=1 Tax=Dryococelus australis TaxID=614101 RepID=A0ABQ9HLS0_9NEOP|nr:hypothetical protein PR048_011493 [Dryococelus australis]